MTTIRVTVEGGIVQWIENVPPGVRVEVWDFDKDHDRCEDCVQNADGDWYHMSYEDGPPAPNPKAPHAGCEYCANCGSRDVQCAAWIDCRDNEVMASGSEGPCGDEWCNPCEAHVRLTYDRREAAAARLETRKRIAQERAS